MKTKIHAFFLCVLTALFAVTASWAETRSLRSDGNGGYYINMPTTGTDNLTITADNIADGVASFKVYDDGGNEGNYSNNAEGYLEVTVPDGYVLQVTGSINTESGWDKLTIYNGDASSETLVDAVSGDITIGPVLSGRAGYGAQPLRPGGREAGQGQKP